MSQIQNEESSPSSNPGTRNASEFIMKLGSIIRENPEIINFDETGTEVVVHQSEAFIKDVLPRLFKHGNWKSFVRQMNMYGFRKINRGANTLIFKHPTFVQGNEHNFKRICRMAGKKKHPSSPHPEGGFLEAPQDALQEIAECFGPHSSISQFLGLVSELAQEYIQISAQVRDSLAPIEKIRKDSETTGHVRNIKEYLALFEENALKFQAALSKISGEASTWQGNGEPDRIDSNLLASILPSFASGIFDLNSSYLPPARMSHQSAAVIENGLAFRPTILQYPASDCILGEADESNSFHLEQPSQQSKNKEQSLKREENRLRGLEPSFSSSFLLLERQEDE